MRSLWTPSRPKRSVPASVVENQQSESIKVEDTSAKSKFDETAATTEAPVQPKLEKNKKEEVVVPEKPPVPQEAVATRKKKTKRPLKKAKTAAPVLDDAQSGEKSAAASEDLQQANKSSSYPTLNQSSSVG